MARLRILATEFRSWLVVVLWIIILLLTIPLARTLQAYVRDIFGDTSFGYFVIAVVIISTAYLLIKLKRSANVLRVSNLVWILVCAAFLIAYTLRLWGNPIEALHFIQYGLLAVLLFNAFLWRHKNYLIYFAVVLAAAGVGIVDETLQWLMPDRVWGISDIAINSIAAITVCVAIAKGVRPSSVDQPANKESLRLVLRLSVLCVVLLMISFSNTPGVIKWYSNKFTPLAFLADNGHIMSEYGYRYRDPEIGLFRSRFNPNDLQQIDKERAHDAAQALDMAPLLNQYSDFIRRYSPMTDPFLHELRVHLNRRDYYLKTGKQQHRYSQEERQKRLQTAWFENRIVEKYFSQTLASSSFSLPPEDKTLLSNSVDKEMFYVSPVSESLITYLSKTQLLALLLALLIGLLVWDFKLRAKIAHAAL